MEIRSVNQVRIYLLVLNNVHDRCEGADVCAVSTDYDKLVEWYRDQYAPEPYREDGYYKVFKKGSEIEWYNPVYNLELNCCDHWNHGIKEMWISEESFCRDMHRYNLIYGG